MQYSNLPFYLLFPNTGIPFLFGIFLAIYPGFVIGIKIEDKIADHRIRKAKRRADYSNYLNFKKVLIDHKEALEAYNDLQRKIRRMMQKNIENKKESLTRRLNGGTV